MKTFTGRISANLPVIRGRIHVPDLSAHATLDFVTATGSPRSIISASDATDAGVELATMPGLSPNTIVDQFGHSFDAIEAKASIAHFNSRRQTHQVWITAGFRLSDERHTPDAAPSSMIGPDALENIRLDVNSKHDQPVSLSA